MTSPPRVEDIKVSRTQGKKSVAVNLSFHAWADDNHMPLKKITIDWGDGEVLKVGGKQSYYKNHKERCTMRDDDGNPCETEGASCRLRFGDTDEACTDKRPFEFSHVYSCEGPGNCVFTPKVQVLDNWGWCNGVCSNPYNVGGVGCYEGLRDDYGVWSTYALQECSRVPSWPGDNPYIDYAGVITITP